VEGTLSGVIAGDTVVLGGIFNTANAGRNRVICNITGISSGNYRLINGPYKVA